MYTACRYTQHTIQLCINIFCVLFSVQEFHIFEISICLNPPKSGNLLFDVMSILLSRILFIEFGQLDTRLNYPFISLSIDNVFEVLSAILTEQRILFLCSSYTVLAYNIEVRYVFVYHIADFSDKPSSSKINSW